MNKSGKLTNMLFICVGLSINWTHFHQFSNQHKRENDTLQHNFHLFQFGNTVNYCFFLNKDALTLLRWSSPL